MTKLEATIQIDEIGPSLDPIEAMMRQPPLKSRCGEWDELWVGDGWVRYVSVDPDDLDIIRLEKKERKCDS